MDGAAGRGVASKFAPWLESLRKELLALSHETVHLLEGADVFDDSGADTDDEEDALARRPVANAGEVVDSTRRLAHQIGRLLQLIREELLPRLPADPDALFLSAAAHFVSKDYDGALRQAREALMAEQRCSGAEAARRHYFLALCALKLLIGGKIDLAEARRRAAGGRGPLELRRVEGQRREDLIVVAEAHLLRAVALGSPSFVSPYVDLDTLASLRHPDDLAAHAADSLRLATAAAATRRFWHSGLQRPPHMLRRLRSRPFYEASEFGWAVPMLKAFGQIKAEMQAARAVARGAAGWDLVGSAHDAGDRKLAEGGDWRELILLNGDAEVAAQMSRNRKRCPITAALLDSIPAACDIAVRGIGESTFSALHGGAHLLPHCGSTNARLTAHLPLEVPEGTCSIRVGDEVREYREGELLVFDDSFEHEVWNRHPTATRVVLLVRFWHPDIDPKDYAVTKRRMRAAVMRHRRNTLLPPLDTPLVP